MPSDLPTEESRFSEASPFTEEEQRATTVFGSLQEFVTEYVVAVAARRTDDGSHVWCPSWWAHAEAIARLSALWRAFEYLCADPSLGLSNWWLHHADPHLAVLLSPDGPFHACGGPDGHRAPEPLPLDTPPEGLFNDPVFSVMTGDPLAVPIPTEDGS
ncbi:DUF4913 domain-containing protein [Streptomyces sp. KL118A]|uniref:DUF4913 domain-containing protein n=1 Tax=Streptomyces sp. KL118A TaxID=3045153 RepID=UPI00278BFDFC|nr:DUF4913 domain-containing protein [Streptomyces sp. KL118A]